MWQEIPSELLRNEIEEVLKPLAEVPDLYNLAREPLEKTRRALNKDISRDYPWPLLPLMVSEAICGHYEKVIPAAAGLEFLLAAGDVFDDIEDDDTPESLSAKYDSAIATNVATTLLILAEKSITRLKGGVEEQGSCDEGGGEPSPPVPSQHLGPVEDAEGDEVEQGQARVDDDP